MNEQARKTVLLAATNNQKNIDKAISMSVKLPFHELMHWATEFGCNNPRRLTNMLKAVEPWDDRWDTDFQHLTTCYCCGQTVLKKDCRLKLPKGGLVCECCECKTCVEVHTEVREET